MASPASAGPRCPGEALALNGDDLSLLALDQAAACALEGGPDDIGVDGERGEVSHVLLSPTVWQFVQSDADVVMLFGPRREGKMCHPATPVLTPSGWGKIGDLADGDIVIAGDGSRTTVTGVYPQPTQPLWRLVFSDGAATVVGDEHLWAVQTGWDRTPVVQRQRRAARRRSATPPPQHQRAGRAVRIVTTREIRQRLDAGAWAHGGRWSIPLIGVADLASQDVPLDPYLLGVLLGDGGLRHGVKVSTADSEIQAAIRAALPDGCRLVPAGTYDYAISGRRGNPVLQTLRALGLAGHGAATKFVPHVYLWNRGEVRHAILQGLLDTDGTISRHSNSVSFTTVSPQLAEDVVFLVRSLGGLARIRTRTTSYSHRGERRMGRLSYHVSVRLPNGVAPFRLARKATLVRPRMANRVRRYLVGYEAAGEGPAVCIKVAHPSGLFVVDHFIVTHNTVGAVSRMIRIAEQPLVADPPPMEAAFVRDFWTNLERTTIETLKDGTRKGWWDCRFYDSDRQADLNDGLVHFSFFGMDRPEDATRFLGYQAAVIGIEEAAPAADLASGVSPEVFGMALSSLSQEEYKTSVQVTMNPPDEGHWTVRVIDLLIEQRLDHLRVETFWIPPGENQHISQRYRDRMRAGLEAIGRHDLVVRLAMGQKGSVQIGERVAHAFADLHVAREPLPQSPRWESFRFWDFWHHPACILLQRTPAGHLNVLLALVGEGVGVDELIREQLLPWMQHHGMWAATALPGRPGVRGYTWRDIGDPSGCTGDQSSSRRSAAKVVEALLHTSFEPGPTSVTARVLAVNTVLNRNLAGRPLVLIDAEDGGPLIRGLRGGWHRMKSKAGVVGPIVKDGHSHPCDAFGYGLGKLYDIEMFLRGVLRDEAPPPPPPGVPGPTTWLGI